MGRIVPDVLSAGLAVFIVSHSVCAAQETILFNPDTDPSRIHWAAVEATLGPPPDVAGQRFGIVIKTQVNEYWRQMAEGYRERAAADGVKVDIQAAQTEDDPARQLSIMQTMVGNRYAALLISPISAVNLQPAIDDATRAGVPVVDVDGAVVDNVRNFVGPINRHMGERVADWFIETMPEGGAVAIIEGQAGVFSTVQRSAGFRDRLLGTSRFTVAASLPGDWDEDKAFEAATTILNANPDLVGMYCNNDTMALAAVEAARALGRLDDVAIFGSDGTRAAYHSIRAGEMAGTIDIFPSLIGSIGLEIGQRLSAGQEVPRVVETPQALVVRQTIDRYAVEDGALLEILLEDARQ